MPIDGYQDKPLVSLEEAVAPVAHLLELIQAKVSIAKGRVKMPLTNSLTLDEAAAIMLYTMEWTPRKRCLYVELNRTLRLEDRDYLVAWFSYLKLLLTGLHKLDSVQRTVWRGIKADLSAQYEEGQFSTWWNLSSTTDSLKVLQSDKFLGKTGTRTLFNIECINGKEIKEFSYYARENEILFLPATYFEVVGKIDSGNGLNIIHVKERKPPYELLKPPFQYPSVGTSNEENNDAISKEPMVTLKDHRVIDTILQKIAAGTAETIDLSFCTISDEELQRICVTLEVNTFVTTLIINDLKLKAPQGNFLAQLVRVNRTLTHLSLTSNELGDAGIQVIAKALADNHYLAVLDVGDNDITSKGAHYIAQMLTKNKSLTQLDISRNQIECEGITLLATALDGNEMLVAIDLSGINMSMGGADCVTRLLTGNNALLRLDLYGNRIGDNGLCNLCQALEKNKTLVKLNLGDNLVSAIGAKYIGKMLCNNGQLENLNLSGNSLGDDDHIGTNSGITSDAVKVITIALMQNTALKSLNLSNNKISDNDASVLAVLLESNSRLLDVDVSCNAISKSGAESFAQMLKKNNTLTTLSLKRNRMGNGGVFALLTALRENRTLKYLYIKNNLATTARVREEMAILKQYNRHVKIELGKGFWSRLGEKCSLM